MAAFTTPDLNDYLPGEPLTSAKALLMVENPLAIAEGSPGAPYVQSAWHPYNGLSWGDGNDGTFYEAAVDGNSNSVVSPDFVAGFEYKIELLNCLRSSVGITGVQIDLFVGSYVEAIDTATTFNNINRANYIVSLPTSHLSLPLHNVGVIAVRGSGGSVSSANESGGTSAAQSYITRARIRTDSGNFASPTKFKMYRRRVE